MTKIDDIAGSDEILMDSQSISDVSDVSDVSEEKTDHGEEIHIPHVPLTGTQKLICVVELILAGLLTVFIFSTIIRHIIELPGRI